MKRQFNKGPIQYLFIFLSPLEQLNCIHKLAPPVFDLAAIFISFTLIFLLWCPCLDHSLVISLKTLRRFLSLPLPISITRTHPETKDGVTNSFYSQGFATAPGNNITNASRMKRWRSLEIIRAARVYLHYSHQRGSKVSLISAQCAMVAGQQAAPRGSFPPPPQAAAGTISHDHWLS